jgi:hypothetical protein
MMRRFQLGLLLALTVPACSSPRTTGLTLAGQWEPVSAELAGQAFPVTNFGGATLRLTADAYVFAGDTGTYTVVAGAPAKMDIHGGPTPGARSRRSMNLQASNLPFPISSVRESVPVTSRPPQARRFWSSTTGGCKLRMRRGS